jgi:hypothetical protein
MARKVDNQMKQVCSDLEKYVGQKIMAIELPRNPVTKKIIKEFMTGTFIEASYSKQSFLTSVKTKGLQMFTKNTGWLRVKNSFLLDHFIPNLSSKSTIQNRLNFYKEWEKAQPLTNGVNISKYRNWEAPVVITYVPLPISNLYAQLLIGDKLVDNMLEREDFNYEKNF